MQIRSLNKLCHLVFGEVLTDVLLSKDKGKQLLSSTFYICGPDAIKSLSQDCLSQLGINACGVG